VEEDGQALEHTESLQRKGSFMVSLAYSLLLVVSGLVLYRLVRRFQRARAVKWLKSNGKRITATVTSVRKQLRGEKGSFTDRMWDLVPHYEITAQ
jgi:hypothetical protein